MSLSIYERAALALKSSKTDIQPVLDAISAIGDVEVAVDLSGVDAAIASVQSAVDGHRGEFGEFITALAAE